MSDLFGKLKAGAGKVAFEADKLAKTQRVKSELDQLNHALENLYAGLGKAVYAQTMTGDPVSMEDWRAKIDEQKLRVQAKERELQAINAETYQQPGAAPAPRPAPAAPASAPIVPPAAPAEPITPPVVTASEEPAPAPRTCPNCGASVPAQSKFCTECGTRMG
jgi:hypothetical protein